MNKPCPFCGSDDVGQYSKTISYHTGFVVICRKCKATGPIVETRKEAWEKWNKRSDDNEGKNKAKN